MPYFRIVIRLLQGCWDSGFVNTRLHFSDVRGQNDPPPALVTKKATILAIDSQKTLELHIVVENNGSENKFHSE